MNIVEIKKQQTLCASLLNDLNVLKASPEEMKEMPPEMQQMQKRMSNMSDVMYKLNDMMNSRLWAMEDEIYKHMSAGHIPAIKSASQMEKALKAIGLGDDYNVMKPTCMTASLKGLEFDIK